jgi:hypothetical protein
MKRLKEAVMTEMTLAALYPLLVLYYTSVMF